MSLTTQQTAIKKELGVIMELAYEKTTTTKNDVFVRYAAHIGQLQVSIHQGGYTVNHDTAEYIDISLSGAYAAENVPAELAKIIRKLQEL